MADLEKITAMLNIKLDINQPNKTAHPENHKAAGYKRRPWLNQEDDSNTIPSSESEDTNRVDQPQNEIGSINPIKTGLINPHEIGSINRVDQPENEIGSINPVDQPEKKMNTFNRVYKPIKIELKNLRGNPKKIAYYLFESAKNTPDRITAQIGKTEITKMLKIPLDSVKTALKFLINNAIIQRIDSKLGRNGWSQYKLDQTVFEEINQAYKIGSIDPINECDNLASEIGSINSSSNYINTTTINRPYLNWENVDVEPLRTIGLTKKHLLQLKTKSTPELVQESIHHFAFSLQFNSKAQKYNDPLSVLIGVLRKGEVWIEPNYKSPQEIALENVILEKTKQLQRQAELEEQLLQIEFQEWIENVTTETKNEILNATGLVDIADQQNPSVLKQKMIRGCLLDYFKKNVSSRK